ncbi:MAG: alpha/beta hydrolase [Chloroflexi bacterium]|nr:alpha/beta hydrolase [Chloroflexota bacterium]
MMKFVLAVAFVLLVLGSLMTVVVSAQNAGASQVLSVDFESEILGRIAQYNIYLPAGYDYTDQRYPVVYLLHGRGDTMAAWLNVRSTLDTLIADGDMPPVIAVMPDMPSSDRGGYYVDSAYTGMLYRAEPVETAFFADLIPHIDSRYRTIADRTSRIVGGYSMGGYGAIRYVLAHPEHFMGAIILSPAVYTPLPPADSSTREFGAFGTDTALFDADIYTALNYPALLEQFTGEFRLNLFIAVGDDEWRHPNPDDIEHDLDFEAHRFFNRVSRVGGIASEFRVYNGGHDWDVWEPGFAEGIRYLSNFLNTTPPDSATRSSPQGWLTGTSSDDVAGGIATDGHGNTILALGVQGGLDGQPYAGGMDIAVVKYGPDRAVQWVRQVGTSGNDRPYGLVVTQQQEIVVAGYTQGDLAGTGSAGGDDIVVLKLSANGDVLWTTQIGTPEADRGYAIALLHSDEVVVTGYTKGAFATENAGDKDVIVARVRSDGSIDWTHQFGGEGEDKGQAVAVGPDGTVYVGGMSSSALTSDFAGGIDGFVAAMSASGELTALTQFGTAEWDEVTGVVATEAHVAVTGFSAGDFVGTLDGDKDITFAAFDSSLQRVAADQLGSTLNDKGAAITTLPDGSFVVAAYSDGSVAGAVGDFDIVIVRYSPTFERQSVIQLGTTERDGTDEWAEKNLFISRDGESVLVSGLTLGSLDASANQGGSDVFVVVIE